MPAVGLFIRKGKGVLNCTSGELLFYGGITGIVIVLIIAVIVIAIIAGSRKKIRNKFNNEYGGKL